MKLKQFIKELQDVVKLCPEALDYDVVYAKDEEGNGFDKVEFTPTLGHFDARDHEFLYLPDLEDEDKANSVCIN